MKFVQDLIHKTDPFLNFKPIKMPEEIQGWNGTSKIFGDLIRQVQPTLIIEVGSWLGQSATTMAHECESNGLKTEIVCIDTWLGATEFYFNKDDKDRYEALEHKNGYPTAYYKFLSNVVLEMHEHFITPFPMDSTNASRVLNHHNVKADMIYIDGSHEHEDVVRDICNYWQLLREGGVMFGDDYNETWSGVMSAVNGKFDNVAVYENNFWIVRKDN